MARHVKIPLLILIMSMSEVLAGYEYEWASNITVYWGQNSYGQSSGEQAQQRLATYCQDTNIDMIQLAFLYQITTGQSGRPVLNFANQQNNCSIIDNIELIDCPEIGADITYCQWKYHKTILLSIGGATYTEGGFTTEQTAIAAADELWAMFGPSQENSSVPRPFGEAVVDGFDLDLESSVSNFIPFANHLRSLMDTDLSRWYRLTAAPQCPYPDIADNAMLNGTVSFDAIFVQFYNNYCGIDSYIADGSNQSNFNFEVWDDWAKTVSLNPDVKIFLGVPAGPTAAGSGYTAWQDLPPVIEYCKTFSSFGGVMMWDVSQAYANSGFLTGVKSVLTAPSGRRIRSFR